MAEDAVLLLHGMTGGPHEMQPLGDALAAAGFRVHIPLLPGHGTRPEDLGTVTAGVLYAAAREALGKLVGARRIVVAGLSMGGLLAALLARDEARRVSSLALLAPAFAMRRPEARFGVWLFGMLPLGPLGRIVVGKRGDRPLDAAADGASYEAIALAAVRALAQLSRAAWQALPSIEAPALVLAGKRDKTADPDVARAAAARLGGGARFVELDSGHVIPLDTDAPRAISLCLEHFSKGAGG